jgi:hypothetical protein
MRGLVILGLMVILAPFVMSTGAHFREKMGGAETSPTTAKSICALLGDVSASASPSVGMTVILHDYHVSITHIDHNPTTQSLEITTKIFTDDLERAITSTPAHAERRPLHLGQEKEAPDANQLILNYLQSHLHLTINGKPAMLLWVGKEVELDLTYCYLEVKGVSHVKELTVENTVLTTLFHDQSNLIHARVGATRKSLNLNGIKKMDCLTF